MSDRQARRRERAEQGGWGFKISPRALLIIGAIVTIVLGAAFFALETGSLPGGIAIFLALATAGGVGAFIVKVAMKAEAERSAAQIAQVDATLEREEKSEALGHPEGGLSAADDAQSGELSEHDGDARS